MKKGACPHRANRRAAGSDGMVMPSCGLNAPSDPRSPLGLEPDWRRGFKRLIFLSALLVWLLAVSAKPGPMQIEILLSEPKPSTRAAFTASGLQFLAGYQLRSGHPEAGGYSGLALSRDANRLLLISDRGRYLELALDYHPDGHLLKPVPVIEAPLQAGAGQNFLNKEQGDAEAVARLPDGGLLIAFEGRHRFGRYQAHNRMPVLDPMQSIPLPPLLTDLPSNGGIEALAAWPDGQLLAFAETLPPEANSPNDLADPQRVLGWMWSGQAWRRRDLSRQGRFRPTDLGILPSGDGLLLERSVDLFEGWGLQLSILPLSALLKAEAGLQAPIERRILLTFHSHFGLDNFEGIAVRSLPDGEMDIFLISDDNGFGLLQATYLWQFRFKPD